MGDQTVFRAPGTDAIKILDGATLAALVFKTAGACDRLGSLFMHGSTALGSTFYERTLFLIAFLQCTAPRPCCPPFQNERRTKNFLRYLCTILHALILWQTHVTVGYDH